MQSIIERWRAAARALKAETLALYFCIRDPRVPWYARAVGAIVVAYTFSPLDLIPDFVPVLGYVDDLILVPLGLRLTLWLIPPQVMADNRARASAELATQRPTNWAAAAVIVLVWIAALVVTALIVARMIRR